MVRIMLVDDHKVVLDGLNVLLPTIFPCEIVSAVTNGKEAIRLIDFINIDLVILDLKMPGEYNGIKVAKCIKNKNSAIKIIAFSMMDDISSINAMISAGVDGYLVKNVSGKEFKEAITLVLDDNIYIHKYLQEHFINGWRNGDVNKRQIITQREEEILHLVVQGHTTKEISQAVYRSEETIKSHRKNLLEKFGCRNTASLVRYAMAHHLVAY